MCLSHTFNILIFGRILQGIYRLKTTLKKPTVITIQWLLQQNRTRCVSRSILTVHFTGLSFWYHTDFLSRAIVCPDCTIKNTPEAKFFPVLANIQQVIICLFNLLIERSVTWMSTSVEQKQALFTELNLHCPLENVRILKSEHRTFDFLVSRLLLRGTG